MRPEFERAGARLAIVSSIDTGAQEFIDTVWKDGDIYIDEAEAFKLAIGGGEKYKNFWLLKPSVLLSLRKVLTHGSSTADVTDKKTQLLGGTFVVKDGEVVYSFKETAAFHNGDARELLAAVLGKDVKDIAELPKLETPKQAEACDLS